MIEMHDVCFPDLPVAHAERHWNARSVEARRVLLEELVRIAAAERIQCGPNRAADIENHVQIPFAALPDMLKRVLIQCADASDINPECLRYSVVFRK